MSSSDQVVERNYTAATFTSCSCERADAIKSLVSISRIVEKVSLERDEALATVGRVRALCDSNIDVATRDGYLLVTTIRKALEGKAQK